MKRLAFLLPVLLVLTACGHDQPTSTEVTFLDGEVTSLEKLSEGKPTLINFWASWCSFCKDELPMLQKVADETSVQVIGVNLQEDPAVANAYWAQGGYSFNALLDPGQVLKKQFGVFTQPTTILIDPQGNEIGRKDGVFTETELEKFVADLEVTIEKIETDSDSTEEPVNTNVRSSTVPPLLDGWYQETVAHLIPLDQIFSGGPVKDGIPSIDDPKFISVDEADFLNEEDLGLLVKIGNEARFYSFKILNWHEIVNDTLGGVPIAVTYCPLCATAVVYERMIDGQEVEFGVSGFLYQSNLLMYDRLTESLWDQVRGQAVVGPITGKRITMFPSDVVKFGTVASALPNTKILSTDTGVNRVYGRDPYEGYSGTPQLYFPVDVTDPRLPVKELTYGIFVNGTAKAYALSDLRQAERIQDMVGETPVLIQYDAATERVRFSEFNPSTLEEVGTIEPVYGFWFSWVSKYPLTEVYTPSS